MQYSTARPENTRTHHLLAGATDKRFSLSLPSATRIGRTLPELLIKIILLDMPRWFLDDQAGKSIYLRCGVTWESDQDLVILLNLVC